MNGTNLIGGGTVGADPGPSWKAIGTGDFFGAKIDEMQYAAARAWARLAARYRLAIEAPRNAKSAGLERIGSRSVGAAAVPGDAVDKAVVDKFLTARSVLLA
jgi:hypothetical protein